MSDSQQRRADQGSVLRDRYTSHDIFERILKAAGDEVKRGSRELFFSALAAGFAITLTFFLYATMTYESNSHFLLSSILYPLGFIYIILGNYQLYTENTVPPVALTVERLSSLPSMFYVWGVVLAGNLIGGLIGAYGLAKLNIFSSGVATAATTIATKALQTQWWTLFHHGAIAGFIVAGLVWLDYAANDTATRFLLVYIAFFAISAASLNHSVVTAVEALYLYFNQAVLLSTAFTDLFLPVVLGNTIGGVFLVTMVNYFQTPDYINQDSSLRLSWKDWLFAYAVFEEPTEDE